MNEQEWQKSTDPRAMLRFLLEGPDNDSAKMKMHWEPLISDRQLQLFVEARACEKCEDYGDRMPLREYAYYVSTADCGTPGQSCDLLREIVGNPFVRLKIIDSRSKISEPEQES